MENKKYIGIPKGKLEQVILSGVLAEKISGRATTKEEVISMLVKKGIDLTDEVKVEINRALPNIDFN